MNKDILNRQGGSAAPSRGGGGGWGGMNFVDVTSGRSSMHGGARVPEGCWCMGLSDRLQPEATSSSCRVAFLALRVRGPSRAGIGWVCVGPVLLGQALIYYQAGERCGECYRVYVPPYFKSSSSPFSISLWAFTWPFAVQWTLAVALSSRFALLMRCAHSNGLLITGSQLCHIDTVLCSHFLPRYTASSPPASNLQAAKTPRLWFASLAQSR